MKTRILLPALFIFTAAAGLSAESDNGFTVHEWGTFTSVQGADGVQMDWNPLVAPELPRFVYDRTHPRSGKSLGFVVLGKTGMVTRQRMETPVIYFYSDRPRTVDVAVKFPEGNITEWYPQESASTSNLIAGTRTDKPVLHWPRVEVLPKAETAKADLPVDSSGSHYYAARQTDASVLRVVDGTKSEQEKFLFYRGVAGFKAPLTVRPDSTNSKHIILTNNGTEELSDLFVYEVRADGGAWISAKHLQPGETRTISLEPGAGAIPMNAADTSLDGAEKVSSMRLNTSLVDALTRAGLYRREASAMVRTWEDAWFGEKGVRVLYLLPRPWTDRTLPLAVTPSPQATERVMVARAEIITPEMETALLHEVERYIAAKPEERAKIVAETRALGLGRFAESVLRRLCATGERSREFSSLSWELLQAISRPEPKTAAAN